MRSNAAYFRWIVLPAGATSGDRIVLDGVNGKITIYDENDLVVVNEDAAGILAQSEDNFVLINPAVPGIPADIVQVQFGRGGRDIAYVEGTSFDDYAVALRLSTGLRTEGPYVSAYSQLLLQPSAVSLFSSNGAALAGILLDAQAGTTRSNFPWQLIGETWHNAVLQNAWSTVGVTAFDAPGYRRDANGCVLLRGVMNNGVVAAGTTVFTLPAAYRPTKRKQMPVTLSAGTTLTAVIQVLEAGHATNPGDVKIYGVPAANAVGLDGIQFDLI